MQTFRLQVLANRYGWNLSQLNVVVTDLRRALGSFWIAGGALRRPILKQDTLAESDFDLFFKDQEGYNVTSNALALAGYKVTRENENNVELTRDIVFNDREYTIKVQLIKVRFYNSLEDVINSFDFTLCQLGWDPASDLFVVGDTSLFDIANKRIVVNKITFPVASLRRIIKYTSQGFYACQGTLTEFLSEVQNQSDVRLETVKYFD